MTNFERVKEFHKVMGLPIGEKPVTFQGICCFTGVLPNPALRNQLILEELSEYNKAISTGKLIDIADALADLLYVVYGTAVEHGIDIDRVFEEVHRSNMTKSGGKIDASGKLLKPKTYEPPNLTFLIYEEE